MHHRDGSRATLRTFDPEAGIRVPINASSKGGDRRTIPAELPSPEVALPGPFVHEPSPVLPVAHGWLRTSAECREVRAERSARRGPAQVGFGVLLSSFHHLTLSSDGILTPSIHFEPDSSSQRLMKIRLLGPSTQMMPFVCNRSLAW